MEILLAACAAVVASVFAAELGRSAWRRPRLHAGIWAAAMGMYALATWALVLGLVAGWSSPVFRTFYLFGAIANIPFLASGSIALSGGERAGRIALGITAAFVVLGGIVTALAPLQGELADLGIPEGSDLFAFTVSIRGVTLAGPRLFAALAGSLGTVIIVGFALRSAVRFRTSNRQLALGNVVIVLGTLAPAAGGSLTALGEASALALSLLLGAAWLYSGYRLAASARAARPAAVAARPRS